MGKILIPLVLSISFTAAVSSPAAELKEASWYLTAGNSPSKLEYKGRKAFEPLSQPDEHYPTIMVDPSKTFQTIEGFGGAFTDASAVNFSRLSPEQKREFLAASFDPVNGNGYTLCRTTIGSCDYSPESYSYDPVEGDKELKYFTIEHDEKDRIPFIKAAQKLAGNGLKLFASPWSPPAWMKSNNDMLYGGTLKPEYDQTWADYFVKYIKSFEKDGVPIWGITVQNEPMAVQIFESCVFTAEEERDFVKNYLGPALVKNNLSDVKLMIWDHNRGIMYQRAQVVYDDPAASKYVWGTAFHWYTGDHFDNVRLVHDAYPDKHLIYTEAGLGGGTLDDAGKLKDWEISERLAKSMIEDSTIGPKAGCSGTCCWMKPAALVTSAVTALPQSCTTAGRTNWCILIRIMSSANSPGLSSPAQKGSSPLPMMTTSSPPPSSIPMAKWPSSS